MKKVLIIVPAYNEELNIKNTINKIKKLKITNYIIDYIVINDGSKDKTLEICHQENINVISLISNLGIGGAVQTGYKYAYYNDYDIAIQFDGDGQHDEKYIYSLIESIENNNDLVVGSRFLEKIDGFKSTKIRRLGKNILSVIIKSLTGKKITDPTSGFRAINKKVIELFAFNYPIEFPEPDTIVFLITRGYKVKEIPVKMHERQFGESSIKPLKSAYYMFSVSLAIIANCLFNKKDKTKERI